MPLSLCVLLLATGVTLLWLKRFPNLAKGFCSSSFILMLFFSWHPISTELLRPIEQQHSEFLLDQPIDYVVVLGNQVESDPAVPLTSHLSSSARARLMEGLRVLGAYPKAKLIVTGYGGNNAKSSAQVYSQVAQSLGIDKVRIIEVSEPKDTQEEAYAVKEIADNKSVALVTSASHMPRAYQFFLNAKVNAIPAPGFYIAKYTEETNWRFDSSGLFKSERALYEYIGQLWAWLKS